MQWKKKDAILSYVERDKMLTKLSKIYGIEDIFGFLNPSKDDLHSYHLLKNIEKASSRIIDAINNKENISVFADPDSDGISSATIMVQYLLNFTKNVCYFHGQRGTGHGIETAENELPKGTQLLIIVDSSTNDVEASERIFSSGIDIIVIDHHIQQKLNHYCVLVNPQQEGCNYPNKNASGAVVTWKVCKAIDDKLKTKFADEFYELCAFGLYGDLVSILEPENRYIIDRGLRNVRNIGVKALLQLLNKDIEKLTTSDIGYVIAPNFNAACRMDSIQTILELLNAKDINIALSKANDVIGMNESRKYLQAAHTERVKKLVDPSKPISIIIDNGIGKGFRGLVCGDLSNEFKICSIIMSEDENDTYSGSLRAYNDFDLMSVLLKLPEVISVEGHGAAAGVRIKRKHLKKLTSKLEELLHDNLKDQYIKYVMEINLSDLTESIIKDVEKFFHLSGKCIETGLFLITNLTVIDKKIMGKDRNTIKLSVVPTSDTYFLDDDDIKKLQPVANLMKFRTNEDYFPDELIGKEIEIVGELNMNEWLNPRTKKVIKTNQIFMEDFRVVD